MARKNKSKRKNWQRRIRAKESLPPAHNPESSSYQITASHTSFIGPLPPPEILESYERIAPGAAQRILTMAEAQSEHRKKLEDIVVRGGARNQTIGMIFAFILSLVTIGVGGFLIYNEKNIEGIGLNSI